MELDKVRIGCICIDGKKTTGSNVILFFRLSKNNILL